MHGFHKISTASFKFPQTRLLAAVNFPTFLLTQGTVLLLGIIPLGYLDIPSAANALQVTQLPLI